ncbi:unnamed protein product [Amoebophrya sp. A25]|nr:unnamed protein product [Amoebophrya sp. A25]|eukprot:GSA25T00010205001.1
MTIQKLSEPLLVPAGSGNPFFVQNKAEPVSAGGASDEIANVVDKTPERARISSPSLRQTGTAEQAPHDTEVGLLGRDTGDNAAVVVNVPTSASDGFPPPPPAPAPRELRWYDFRWRFLLEDTEEDATLVEESW